MATKGLPREQALNVLNKFATDDKFRSDYVANPVETLKNAGVAHDVVTSFAPEHLNVTSLPPKSHFAATYQSLADNSAQQRLAMMVPFLKLSFGEEA